MICFLWCYNAKLNWKTLQTIFFPNSLFPKINWRREISLPVNSLMANNLTLQNHSEQGIEKILAERRKRRFFDYCLCSGFIFNMKPRSANAFRLCILVSYFFWGWGISIAAPELGLSSCSAGCTKTSPLSGELVKLIWQEETPSVLGTVSPRVRASEHSCARS